MIEEFDRNGNLTRETKCLDRKCEVADVEVRIYNEKGQLVVDSIYTNQWGYHQLVWRTQYSYYDDDRLRTKKRLTSTCGKGFTELLTYFYDKQGKLIRIEDAKDCIDGKYSVPIYFKYDSLGNQVEEVATLYKKIYEYDKNGNLLSEVHYSQRNDTFELSSTTIFMYDSLNRRIEKRWITSNFYVEWSKYIYSRNGLLETEFRYIDGWLSWFNLTYKKGQVIWIENYYISKKGQKLKGPKVRIKYKYYKD